MTRRWAILAGLTVVSVAAMVWVFARSTGGNYRAIVRSCEILNDKIVESQRSLDADSSSAVLIGVILRNATPAERRLFLERVAAEREHPRLGKVDCEREARKARHGE